MSYSTLVAPIHFACIKLDADSIKDAIKGGDCTTTDDELTVTFKLGDRDSGTAKLSDDVYVYRIGGNVGSKRAQMPYGFGTADVGGGQDDYDDPPLSTVTPEMTDTVDVLTPAVDFADHPLIKRTEEVGGSMRSKVGRGCRDAMWKSRLPGDRRTKMDVSSCSSTPSNKRITPSLRSLRPTDSNATVQPPVLSTDTDTDSYIDLRHWEDCRGGPCHLPRR